MTTYVAVVALVLAYVALVSAYLALRTLAKLRRANALLSRESRDGSPVPESVLEATGRTAEQVGVLGENVAELRTRLDTALSSAAEEQRGGPGALRHVALVRYDAFTEMSGHLSFSLAMLDDHGDGVTISAIASGGDTRVYAKGVADGTGEHELSPEEKRAVDSALSRRRGLLGVRRSA